MREGTGDDAQLWSVDAIQELMEERIPFNKLLRMKLVDVRPRAVLQIPFFDALVGDSKRPALHGGVISTLLDTACGVAAFGTIPAAFRISTIDLSVDYVRPAPLKGLEATAWVIRSGNRVILAHGEVRSVDETQVLAHGRAVYSVHQPR